MRFFRNGEQCVPAPPALSMQTLGSSVAQMHGREALRSKAASAMAAAAAEAAAAAPGLAIAHPARYSLVPAVSMYQSSRGAESRVRFNFSGPFAYPVEGSSPFGGGVTSSESCGSQRRRGPQLNNVF